MAEQSKAVGVGIEGVFYSLTHVPDLVRYGSKPSRELRVNTTLDQRLKNQLRSFSAATAYAPHQVYIGNITPAELSHLPKPWYESLSRGPLAMDDLATWWIRTGFTASLRKPTNSTSLLWKKNGFRNTGQNQPTTKACAWGH